MVCHWPGDTVALYAAGSGVFEYGLCVHAAPSQRPRILRWSRFHVATWHGKLAAAAGCAAIVIIAYLAGRY